VNHHRALPKMRRADLLDIAELIQRTGMTATEISRAVAERRFPTPTTGHMPGVPLWLADEIEEVLVKRWLR
jgi:predicted DNA-binding transcriptional regulator AlpA